MSEDTICEECGDLYSLRDGCEPSKYCDECAQDVVIRIARELTAAIERAEKAEKQLTEMTAIAEELAEKLISLMYKLPREDCQCEFCVLLRRFEEIKEGIQ